MIHDWSIRHHVSLEALNELRAMLTMPAPAAHNGKNETDVQARVRVLASERGDALWRNNVGVAVSADGRPVRYGLCNDSAKLNAVVKSADLIGIRRVLITSAHVGQYVGQFYSVEVKRTGWKYAGTPREQAQLTWAEQVVALGGCAEFSTGELKCR